MVHRGRLHAAIVMVLVLLVAIVHFGVAIGVIARDRKYGDILSPQVGLGAFNIVIGFLAFLVGGFGLFAVFTNRGILSKIVAITSAVLGVFAIASLITALVINGQSISYVSKHLMSDMGIYGQNSWATNIIDKVQDNFHCCGLSSWLDWAPKPSGGNSAGTIAGTTGTNTGTLVTNTGTNTGGTAVVGKRRRRQGSLFTSPLQRALRRKRQTLLTPTFINTLLPNYGFTLPLSCCTNGGSSNGNTLGTNDCVSNGTSAVDFYIDGCLQSIANVAVGHTTGIAVINCFLIVLAYAVIPSLIHLYPESFVLKNRANKQQMQQIVDPQNQNGGYSMNNADPNAYYNNSNASYAIPQ